MIFEFIVVILLLLINHLRKAMKITNEEFQYMKDQVKKFKDAGYQIRPIEKKGKEISIVLMPIVLIETVKESNE